AGRGEDGGAEDLVPGAGGPEGELAGGAGADLSGDADGDLDEAALAGGLAGADPGAQDLRVGGSGDGGGERRGGGERPRGGAVEHVEGRLTEEVGAEERARLQGFHHRGLDFLIVRHGAPLDACRTG